MKVLVALDAGPQCGEIVEQLVARPWPAGTSFILLHVLDPFPYTRVPLALTRVKEECKGLLEKLRKRLCGSGWVAEANVVLGLARREIAKIAASSKADLVVMGSHEIGALTRLFLGSTARSVLRHAPCSVEIVRPTSQKHGPVQSSGMKVFVATDGSDYAIAALESVASRPWPTGTKFRVVSIPEPFLLFGQFPYFEVNEVERGNSEAAKDSKRFVESGAEILSKIGAEVETDIPFPKEGAARQIVEEAERWGAEMIAVGSHGRQGFERWTLGSVSEHVALHAHCSVEVIRAPMPAKENHRAN
jgi:nucleotide-binding universal stress UspA family protein